MPHSLTVVREVLDQTRALLRGEEVEVVSLVGLTGIVLESKAGISGPWGRLRPARPGDHPDFVESMVERRITTTTASGERLEISDAGDVVFELRLPYRVHVQPDSRMIMSSATSNTLDEMIERARIALSVSWTGPQIPVVLPTWRRTISFMTRGIGHWFDPQLAASRTPVKVATEDAENWGRWVDKIDLDQMSRVKLAVTRTLRCLTERRDPDDMLIDAVIAWEALFGATSESTLRVSAALACLLYAPGQDRLDAQERFRKIYALRSSIVHGSLSKKTTLRQVHERASEAGHVAVRALRELFESRPDLIQFEIGERSLRLILEG